MRLNKLILAFLLSIFTISGYAQLNTDRLVSIGRNALYFNDYLLSIQYFNKAIKAKPQLIEPYYLRAIAKIELEDFSGAEKDLNKVIEANPFIPISYYARGYARKKMMKYEQAVVDFEYALKYEPDNVHYSLNLIEVLEYLEQHQRAEELLDHLIARMPQLTDLLFEKGRLQFLRNDTVGTKNTYDILVNADSQNPDAYFVRGVINQIMDSTELALQDYNKAEKLHSLSSPLYANRAIIYYKSHNYNAAIKDYDKAIALDGKSVNARFNRALLRNELGDLNNAVADLDTIILNNPTLYEAIYERAVINYKLRFYKQSIEDLTTIIGAYPHFVPALYARAQAYEKVGNNKAAYKDRTLAYKLEDDYRNNKLDTISLKTQIQTDTISSLLSLVKSFASDPSSEPTSNSLRGSIQNNKVSVEPQASFVITYYKKQSNITKYYPSILQLLSSSKHIYSQLYITNEEVPLSQALIDTHFASIESLSEKIAADSLNYELYFARAFDYALVQDYNSAINDLTHVINLNECVGIASFCRAYIRYKQFEMISNSTQTPFSTTQTSDVQNKQYYELVLLDYNHAIERMPNFPFSYFNKANILAEQNDYNAAIEAYTAAIRIEPDFAEAYYNRALIYIIKNQKQNAINDMSRAGELGMYQAYSIIKNLQ